MASGCYELRDMVLAYGIIPWPRQRACPAAPPPDPVGACCLPGGGCQVLTEAACTAQGGTWYANDDCNFPTPCVGGPG